MMTQETVRKMNALKLHGMAHAFTSQIETPSAAHLSFEERVGLLIDHEVSFRDDRRLRRLLASAKLREPACMEDIDYQARRGLERSTMASLGLCNWIKAGVNLAITGKTGVGKSICVLFALLVAAIPLALTLRLHSAERTLWEISGKNGSTEDHGMWKPYAAEARAAALASRKVVVTDFTAEWCINCKLLEAAVLSTEDVRNALSGTDVLALRADLTARTAPGKPRLKEINEVGIPVVTFEGPGTAEPIKLYFGCTVTDVLDAIKQARGTAKAP